MKRLCWPPTCCAIDLSPPRSSQKNGRRRGRSAGTGCILLQALHLLHLQATDLWPRAPISILPSDAPPWPCMDSSRDQRCGESKTGPNAARRDVSQRRGPQPLASCRPRPLVQQQNPPGHRPQATGPSRAWKQPFFAHAERRQNTSSRQGGSLIASMTMSVGIQNIPGAGVWCAGEVPSLCSSAEP